MQHATGFSVSTLGGVGRIIQGEVISLRTGIPLRITTGFLERPSDRAGCVEDLLGTRWVSGFGLGTFVGS